MGFSGSFTRKMSVRAHSVVLYSFTLKCTNLFQSETVDIGFFPSNGNQPWYWRRVPLKAGKKYDFDYDTENIEWYNHDRIAILDSNGNPIPKYTWELNLKEYGPGECPKCHGTKRCRACNGQGYIYPRGQVWNMKMCTACGGTGECQECDVPTRGPGSASGGPRGIGNGY